MLAKKHEMYDYIPKSLPALPRISSLRFLEGKSGGLIAGEDKLKWICHVERVTRIAEATCSLLHPSPIHFSTY